MQRVILVSGKGGTGKTTIASATALAAANRGHRTLALSFDLAHSLSDAFDLDRGLFDQNKGLPFSLAPNLDIQEIDVQEEMEREWRDLFKFLARTFTSQGMSSVMAEEMAILPGMHDVIALLHINQYLRQSTYDVIVVDCPPTTESLQFVGITSIIEWYIRRRYNIDRNVVKYARPLLEKLNQAPVPVESDFDTLYRLFSGIEGINDILLDPAITTVRLVTNPEKMVVRETQRAYMYFSMYGVATDQVVVNRVFPAGDSHFAGWARTQARYLNEIEDYFRPMRVSSVPWFEQEMIGIEHLNELADLLYPDVDPTDVFISAPPYELTETAEGYRMRLRLPFLEKSDVDVTRLGDEIVVRVGSFKQYVGLPRAVARLKVAGARMSGDQLVITFVERNSVPAGG